MQSAECDPIPGIEKSLCIVISTVVGHLHAITDSNTISLKIRIRIGSRIILRVDNIIITVPGRCCGFVEDDCHGGQRHVGVDDGDIIRTQPTVAAVAAVGGGQHDSVALVAVVQRIIDASDGDRLIRIPVGGSESQQRGRDHAFGSVGTAHANRHVGGRLAAENDGERCRTSGFGGVAADAADGEACRLSFPTSISASISASVSASVSASSCS